MKNKAILICLEKLGSGGVETAVYNQSLAFKEKGYNVVILAKKGIYTEKLQEKGITCIDFEFNLGNEIDIAKTKQVIEIIKNYNIGQVHIHQYPCLLSVFPACIITNTPYVPFIHATITDVFDWYINTFSIYKRLLKLYFENAYKIMTINYGSIDTHSKYFDIDKSKYKVLRNSILFDEYISKTEIQQVKKFMIITRIAPEKIISIQNGIKCFIEYANTFQDFDGELAIYGDGTEENVDIVKRYIAENNTNNHNIYLAGSTNEVAKEMEKYDVVIAMGRCIIEAIATKRLAIVTSSNELKFLVTSSNIYEAIEGIFARDDLKAESLENIIRQLKNLNTEEIKNIVEKNYEIALKELDMRKNVYCIEELYNNENYEMKLIELMDIQLEDLKNQRDDNIKKCYELSKNIEFKNNETENRDKIVEEQRKIIEEQKEIIEQTEKRNIELYNELNSVYNSKRFKLVNKIANTFIKK